MIGLYQAINSPLLVIGVITLLIPVLLLAIVYVRTKKHTATVHRESSSIARPTSLQTPVVPPIGDEVCQIECGQVVWRPREAARNPSSPDRVSSR